MRHQNRGIRYLLLAAILSPAFIYAPSADAARKSAASSASFQCMGIGRGHHSKNMTEAECLKQGGSVERDSGEKTVPVRAAAPHRSAPAAAPRRSGLIPEEKFSCRGIGTGHHTKGMTESDCVRMGGTVEKPR
jgi:hypothetical protein